MNIMSGHGINLLFAIPKQRNSTEASLQHGNLRDSPPGGLPQPVRGDGQQQLRAHQCWCQGLWQAEEKCPDVSTLNPPGNSMLSLFVKRLYSFKRNCTKEAFLKTWHFEFFLKIHLSVSFCAFFLSEVETPARKRQKKKTWEQKSTKTKAENEDWTGPLSAPSHYTEKTILLIPPFSIMLVKSTAFETKKKRKKPSFSWCTWTNELLLKRKISWFLLFLYMTISGK